MRRVFIIVIILVGAFIAELPAQTHVPLKGGRATHREVIDGVANYDVEINPIVIYARPTDMRKHARLVRNVKIVYPYAKEAAVYMNKLETELLTLKTKREREKFTKAMEKEIVKKYTPILKQMTFSQGKILIKLIDRETQRSSYSILKEFRGGLAASFWNTIARIFKANLKETYNPEEGEDAIIEHIITMYEAGTL